MPRHASQRPSPLHERRSGQMTVITGHAYGGRVPPSATFTGTGARRTLTALNVPPISREPFFAALRAAGYFPTWTTPVTSPALTSRDQRSPALRTTPLPYTTLITRGPSNAEPVGAATVTAPLITPSWNPEHAPPAAAEPDSPPARPPTWNEFTGSMRNVDHHATQVTQHPPNIGVSHPALQPARLPQPIPGRLHRITANGAPVTPRQPLGTLLSNLTEGTLSPGEIILRTDPHGQQPLHPAWYFDEFSSLGLLPAIPTPQGTQTLSFTVQGQPLSVKFPERPEGEHGTLIYDLQGNVHVADALSWGPQSPLRHIDTALQWPCSSGTLLFARVRPFRNGLEASTSVMSILITPRGAAWISHPGALTNWLNGRTVTVDTSDVINPRPPVHHTRTGTCAGPDGLGALKRLSHLTGHPIVHGRHIFHPRAAL